MDSDSNRTESDRTSVMTFSIQLENIAKEIFRSSGYKVENHKSDSPVDFVARQDKEEYLVDVKGSFSLEYHGDMRRSNLLVHCHENQGKKLVLFVFAVVDERRKKAFTQICDDLIVVDLPNILYAVNGTPMRETLVSILPFSTTQIEETKGEIDLGWIEHSDKGETLLAELSKCLAGKKDATKFEKMCFDMLKFIFFEDLTLWKEQPRSNNDLYRFDLLCRIKDDTKKTLWSMLERYFNSKYIIFEFKNYTDKITQKEIYTTEKYLYEKALRKVAVIVARNGFDTNSVWAARGCLRENGKLILLVTIDEVKKMIEMKKKQEDPTEVLLSKIDEMLIDLEK